MNRDLANIPSNDFVVTELLGYLTPKQWACAIRQQPYYREEMVNLIREQERTFSGSVLKEVREELGEEDGLE